MSQVENLKIGNVTYGITDANTLPALTTAQRTTLLTNGTYLGNLVDNGKIFETDLGKFESYYDEQTNTWGATSVTLPASKTWRKVRVANNKLFLIPEATNSNYSNMLAYTENGTSWSTTTLPKDCIYSPEIAYGNGRYVLALSNTTTPRTIYSTDLVTWQDGDTTLPFALWAGMEFINNQFVLFRDGGNVYYTSTDGVTWSSATFTSDSNPSIQRFKYYNGRYMAVSSRNNAIYYSSDLLTWSKKTSAFPSSKYTSDFAYGNGIYVLVGTTTSNNVLSSTAYYSTDGLTWNSTNLPFEAPWNSVAYGDGKFVAICGWSDRNQNKAAYSTDGINWTVVDMYASNNWYSCGYINEHFICAKHYHNSNFNVTNSLNPVTLHDRSLTPLSYSASEVDTALSGKQGTLTAGTGINLLNGTISTPAMIGADGTNPGTLGAVPAPAATDNAKYLRGDGTWAEVSGGSGADIAGERGIIVKDNTYNGILQSNSTISDNVLTCNEDTFAGFILPSNVTNLNNKDMSTFDLYIKAYVVGSPNSSFEKTLITLFGGKIVLTNGQSRVHGANGGWGGSSGDPYIRTSQDVLFRISKNAEQHITTQYKLSGSDEWLQAAYCDEDYTATDWQGEWILGADRDRFTWKGTKFYLEDCYLLVDGTEVWRGSDAGQPVKVISVDKSVLTNDSENKSTLYPALGIKSKHCNGNGAIAIGYNSNVTATGATGIGDGATITEYMGTAVGYSTRLNSAGQTVVGAQSGASRLFATALGFGAHANAIGSIQLGAGGTNTSAGTLAVCLAKRGYDQQNYTLLRHDGKIPVERLAEIIITGPYDPTEETKGTLGLLYKNTSTGKIFRCSNIEEAGSGASGESDESSYSGTIYTWSELLDASNVYTKEEVDTLLEFIVGDIETRLSRV